MERRYDHRSTTDLLDLQEDLRCLSLEQQAVAGLASAQLGLAPAPWWLRAVLAAIWWRHGAGQGTVAYAAVLAMRAPNVVRAQWRRVTRHMLAGRNLDDPTSAGGWNRRDLVRFLDILRAVGWQPPAIEDETAADA